MCVLFNVRVRTEQPHRISFFLFYLVGDLPFVWLKEETVNREIVEKESTKKEKK